jgi:hypothetical protein
LHGIAYYVFLKSLRSLEEFRKNPHVKIPPKSPCTNFHSLGKFKNPIFNSKISFLHFWPGRPCGPLGRWPSRPHWPLSSRGRNSTLPAQPARVSMAYLRKYVFPLGSRLLSWPPPSHLSVKWAQAIRFVFLPRPSVPLPSHYKRTRRTPRPSPHPPRPQSLASESTTPTPPSASSTDCSPPSPGRV